MKKKRDQVVEEGRKAGLSARELDELRSRVLRQEQELTLKIYDFFKEHLKDDQDLKDYARRTYESHKDYFEEEYGSFEDWYESCEYNMESNNVAGVEEWLGQLQKSGRMDKFLEDIKFKEFVDGQEGHFNVELRCVEGVYIDLIPYVLVHVDMLAD